MLTRQFYSTLKSVAIQLLSFFSSDKVEQTGGHHSINLDTYKMLQKYVHDTYVCHVCKFGTPSFTTEAPTSTSSTVERLSTNRARAQWPALDTLPGITKPFATREVEAETTTTWPTPQESSQILPSADLPWEGSSSAWAPSGQSPILGRNAQKGKAKENAEIRARPAVNFPAAPAESSSSSVIPMDLDPTEPAKPRNIVDIKIPNEVLILICDQLDTEELLVFAAAWARISRIMNRFDLIRTRELRCFCLKKDYLTVKLGVGVHVEGRSFESEFDILSETAFSTHRIRRSTQGRRFEYWLPLPISNGHWRKVAGDVNGRMLRLAASAKIQGGSPFKLLCTFMNDIVVKLNQASESQHALSRYDRYPYASRESTQSSLTHASEKAIESYFHLFHLLVCLAISKPDIIASANSMINSFVSGRTSKADCPNIGHLLVAALVSEIDVTERVIKAIIKETVTRNVVWMLKSNPELAYFEPSPVSEYRLHHTLQASKTSYRLLMFLNLFRKTAVGTPHKPLIQLRDEAFERHGAPPRGSAKGLAMAIKDIHAVNRFPDFLAKMEITKMPTKEQFNLYLHDCIHESHKMGYSRMAVSQGEALALRLAKERGVEVARGVVASTDFDAHAASFRNFFPDRWGGRGRGGRGRGGRGRGGGR